ncbi:MAG: hypothetical protein EOO46_24500 [Flavobacterium sp.]|nr:MAG: hypothetical protein EOO46_24500 [Flavobacterium sp.]
METKQDWSIEWVTFFDEYSGDFHPSFKLKLAKQLSEKGSKETGIKGFDKYDFQLLIGQEDLKLQEVQGYMFALVDFITPPAYSQPVWICWKAEGVDLRQLHSKDVSNIDIHFHWGGNFPKEETLPYLKPYKKEKKAKTGLHFDIEYYYNAFPDISFEINFTKPPLKGQVSNINNFVAEFAESWNRKNPDNAINQISPLTKKDKNVFEIVADIGTGNSMKTVGLFLKELSGKIQSDSIGKIVVK